MYHPHQVPSTSTSTSSSYTSRMMLLDQQTQLSPPMPPRDSIFIKKSLKKQQQLQRKRRESVGEVVGQHRKCPISAIKPRRTQSSILQAPKKNRKRYSLQQPINTNSLTDRDTSQPAVHWDPHIDAFEILRAKITGITRSMQEFHVQELFNDEMQKRSSYFPTVSTSSPLSSHHSRRLSLANLSENNFLSLGHRRIKSQSFAYDTDTNKKFNEKESDSASIWDSDQDDYGCSISSSNRTALFLTTSNLINSHLDELCDTSSVKSSSDSDWDKQFLSLLTSCIHQSEALESFSTLVLNTEHRLRELMLINNDLHEQFHNREKQYEDRIRQCQEVAQQQLMMIDSLEELISDISLKTESRTREMHRQQSLTKLDANNLSPKEEIIEEERWNFQQSVSDLLNMNDKHDVIQKMRWEIGMFVGGGVGTGHVIHSFDNKLNGIDMMIAGTGTTTTLRQGSYLYNGYQEEEEQESFDALEESYSATPSIRHIKLYQHHYILHLSSKDRHTRFAMLPKRLWVSDHEKDQCQFDGCPTRFSFFQRKHHCRKCGYIMCQRHSANRLPLFRPRKNPIKGQWSRVCDHCFHDLIVQKQ